MTAAAKPDCSEAYREFIQWKNKLQGDITSSDVTIIKSAKAAVVEPEETKTKTPMKGGDWTQTVNGCGNENGEEASKPQ